MSKPILLPALLVTDDTFIIPNTYNTIINNSVNKDTKVTLYNLSQYENSFVITFINNSSTNNLLVFWDLFQLFQLKPGTIQHIFLFNGNIYYSGHLYASDTAKSMGMLPTLNLQGHIPVSKNGIVVALPWSNMLYSCSAIISSNIVKGINDGDIVFLPTCPFTSKCVAITLHATRYNNANMVDMYIYINDVCVSQAVYNNLVANDSKDVFSVAWTGTINANDYLSVRATSGLVSYLNVTVQEIGPSIVPLP